MSRNGIKYFGSLKTELIGISVLLVMTMSGAMAFSMFLIYSEALTSSALRSAQTFAAGAAVSMAGRGELSRTNWRGLDEAAKANGLQLMLAADSTGSFLYRHPDAAAGDEIALRLSLSGSGEEVAWRGGSRDQRRHFVVAVPVLRHNFVAGAVSFSGDLTELSKMTYKVLLGGLGTLLINIALMGLFIAFFLNRRLVAPLKELAADFSALSRNDFRPHERPVASKEVTELFKTFDQSAEELMGSRRKLEKQLATITRTQKQLVESEKMVSVGHLASGLAHELGNPIGALMGFVHLLHRDDTTPEERSVFLKQAEHELVRMDKSIKALLNFSRPSRPESGPVNLVKISESALALVKVQKWSQGVKWGLEADENLPLALGEHNALLQVLLNLLANAGQAFQAGAISPEATIRLTEENGEIKVTVTDNGPGVVLEDVPHLFEPYFTRKAPGQGTGLGLAISRSIINQFGGQLEYAAAEKGGAIFYFQLPAASPADQENP